MKTLYLNSIRIAALSIGMFLVSTTVCNANVGSKPTLKLNEVSIENELSIEDWMVDLTKWSSSATTEVFENEIEIENWMLSANDWSTNQEEEIEVEDWMTNLVKW